MLLALCLQVGRSKAAPERSSLSPYFEPFATEEVALSSDGRYLAFSEHSHENLSLGILDLDLNVRREIPLGSDEATLMSGNGQKTPARLTFLRWGVGGRLLFNFDGRNLWAIDADGGNQR